MSREGKNPRKGTLSVRFQARQIKDFRDSRDEDQPDFSSLDIVKTSWVASLFPKHCEHSTAWQLRPGGVSWAKSRRLWRQHEGVQEGGSSALQPSAAQPQAAITTAHGPRKEAGAQALLWVPAAVPRDSHMQLCGGMWGGSKGLDVCVYICPCSRHWGNHYILILDADNTMRDILTLM